MSNIINALTALTQAVGHLAEEQNRHANAVLDQTHEQRITNLLVRSQITTDPVQKQELLRQAEQTMDLARRSRRRAESGS